MSSDAGNGKNAWQDRRLLHQATVALEEPEEMWTKRIKFLSQRYSDQAPRVEEVLL